MSGGKKGAKGKQNRKKREGGREQKNNNIEILGSSFSQDQLH